jgi:hypothetical protein
MARLFLMFWLGVPFGLWFSKVLDGADLYGQPGFFMLLMVVLAFVNGLSAIAEKIDDA